MCEDEFDDYRFYMGPRDEYCASRKAGRPPSIDALAHHVAGELSFGKRTFGKILPQLIANQQAMNPRVRQSLLDALRGRTYRQRKLADKELTDARRLEAWLESLEIGIKNAAPAASPKRLVAHNEATS